MLPPCSTFKVWVCSWRVAYLLVCATSAVVWWVGERVGPCFLVLRIGRTLEATDQGHAHHTRVRVRPILIHRSCRTCCRSVPASEMLSVAWPMQTHIDVPAVTPGTCWQVGEQWFLCAHGGEHWPTRAGRQARCCGHDKTALRYWFRTIPVISPESERACYRQYTYIITCQCLL